MTTRATRSSARVASASTPSGNSKLENDVKMKAICESANAYESFLNSYGKLISSAKTREETIIHLIEHKCTKVYVPLLLSKEIYLKPPVVEAIARLNQRLDGFTEDQKKSFFAPKHDRARYYISIAINSVKDYPERKKEDYTEFICTAMHYSKAVEESIYQFADFTTFLDIFNCWIKEYSSNGKILDNSTKSYLSIVPDVLPKYQEHVLDSLLSMIILTPKYELLEPWGEKEHDNIFNIEPKDTYQSDSEYLSDQGEIISYIESIAHLVRYLMDQQNVKMLQHLAKHFPLKSDSRFVEIINDVSRLEVFQAFYIDLFTKKLWNDAKLVKQFINTYYKLTPITQKYDTFLNIMSKETAIGEDAKKFVDKLFPLHRMAIMNRSRKTLQDEWESNREAYGKMINTLDHFGLTPIAYAILFQNIEAIKFFTSTSPSFQKLQKVGKKKIDYSISVSVLKDGFTIEDLIKVYANDDIGKFFETKKDIQARWKTNIIKGYHQTSPEVAEVIEHTPSNEFWFLAGSVGMFGPGIYFARTSHETQRKAHQHGVILEADLLLGNPLNITSHSERDAFVTKYPHLDVDMLYHALQMNGYDSVVAIRDTRLSNELREARIGRFMQTGNEYMVYNTEQALFTRVVPRPPRSAQMGGTKHSGAVSLPPWLVPVQKGDLVALKKLPKTAYHAHWLLNSTPLMVACARGHMDIVKWLLEEAGAGVAINAKDLVNRNAVFYAMRGGKKEIVHYLITKGAHLLEKDTNGKYAVEYFNVRPLEKAIDLHVAKRVSVPVGYREVLLKELVRMGDPAMEAVLRFYRNTMRPMTDDIKDKFVAYFSVRAHVRVPTRPAMPEPWMGATPLRKEQAAYGGGRKRSGKK